MDFIGSFKQDPREKIHGLDDDAEEYLRKREPPPLPHSTILDNYPDTSMNPYEYMGLERNATEEDIKRAYKKGALRWHPDKHPPAEKAKAQKAFQRLTTAYAVLLDPVRREHYDATGKVHEALHLDPEDPWRWQPFYQHCFNKMAEGDLEKFAKEYRHSEEERKDLLKAYKTHRGDMSKIYEHVTLSNPLEDDTRYRQWINEAIEKKEIRAYNAFTKEPERSIKHRLDIAKKEAQEAEEAKQAMKEAGNWFEPPSDEDPEERLAIAIQEKNKSRNLAFLEHLMDKYASKPPKKGKGKKGGKVLDEPSEEAFERNRKNGFHDAVKRDKERSRKDWNKKHPKRKAEEEPLVDQTEGDHDVPEEPLLKRARRLRKRARRDAQADVEALEADPSDISEEDTEKADMEKEIYGEPLKKGAKSNYTAKTKAAFEAKKKADAAKLAKNTAAEEAEARQPNARRRGKRAVVDSDDEDEEEDYRIELGSEDSDEDDEDGDED